MANFMQAFEDQREDYLSHYGVKGQRWGVITSEYEPVGDQPGGQEDSGWGLDMKWDTPAMREKERRQSEYSQQDQESMQQSADAIRQADAESVKDKRKRIVKNIVKGVAIGAIVAGIAAGAVKGYAKKQTGEKQDLATSIGIVGQKFRSAPGQVGDAVKKGFNMDTGAVKAENEAEQIRKRDERIQAFKNAAEKARSAVGTAAGKVGSAVGKAGQAVGNAAGKAGSAIGTAAGKAGSAIGNAVENAKKNFEARDQARFQAAMARRSPIKPGTEKMDFRSIMEERKNGGSIQNIRFPQGQGRFGSGTEKMDFGSIVSERAKNSNEANDMDIQNIRFPWADKSRTKRIDPESLRNRYNSRRGYYETPRSRIYRG